MKKTKKNLTAIQQDFTSHLLDKKHLNILEDSLYSKQETLARMAIYRNNVFSNFESILSSIFEAVKKIIGEDNFKKLVTKYNKKFPSVSGNLNDYGNNFPDFIKGCKPSYLKDLAQLELFYHQAYFAKDSNDFAVEKFQKLSPEKYKNLTFTLHPSCFLFTSKFPVFSLWKNKINDEKKSVKIVNNPELAMIARTAQGLNIHKLSEEEFLFLSLLEKGKTLYNIFENISKKTKREIDIGKLLNHFISSGMIADFKSKKYLIPKHLK